MTDHDSKDRKVCVECGQKRGHLIGCAANRIDTLTAELAEWERVCGLEIKQNFTCHKTIATLQEAQDLSLRALEIFTDDHFSDCDYERNENELCSCSMWRIRAVKQALGDTQ
jgi:hypothetical protein